MVQVAKRGASVLKRRKSRNRMDGGPSGSGAAASSSQMASNSGDGGQGPPPRSESDGDVVFYSEEPRSGACSRPGLDRVWLFFFLVCRSSFTIATVKPTLVRRDMFVALKAFTQKNIYFIYYILGTINIEHINFI